MLELPGITLVCADTANHALALRAFVKAQEGVRYGRMLFLTDAIPPGIAVPDGVEVVRIGPLTSRDAYSQLMLKGLLPHIDTPHALVIQWDGYVVNPDAWDPAFADFDYIGAQWYWHEPGQRIGNGGFSLRSRKLLAALQDPRITLVEAEDATIGRTFRPLLEREHGIRFADESLADRFSFEAAYPIGRPFGFHGLFNFCRTVPPAEIAALAPSFSNAIARSPQLLQLMRNCVALGQWDAASALARRILAATPGHAEAEVLLARSERGASQPSATGRNDPCPCGSGKKFKHCHGALGGGVPATPPAPPDPDALVRAALATHQRGDIDAAERGYREALERAPGHPTAMHYLGVAAYQRGHLETALPLLHAAVEAAPKEAEFHNNLGLALVAADRSEEAIAAHRRALDLRPGHAATWSNLGLALQANNQVPDAIAAYRSAIGLEPEFAQAHWNLGLALLAHEEFDEGWREYAWRHKVPELARLARRWPGPKWDGGPPDGLTLLVTTEQGLGDTLQFIRLARALAARGARVLVSAQQPLVRLLASAQGVAAVYGPDETVPAYDAHIPLIDLAGMLGVTPATIPSAGALPRGGPRPPWRDRIDAGAARRRAQGRSCVVGQPAKRQRTASLDSPPKARAAARDAECRLVFAEARERGDGDRNGPGAQALQRHPAREDFDGLAALVAELDLVVSVDTSIAHLGGALARPTWVLLASAADWRWQSGRLDSPWYPTVRLFRQPRAGDWEAVIRDVVAALSTGRPGSF